MIPYTTWLRKQQHEAYNLYGQGESKIDYAPQGSRVELPDTFIELLRPYLHRLYTDECILDNGIDTFFTGNNKINPDYCYQINDREYAHFEFKKSTDEQVKVNRITEKEKAYCERIIVCNVKYNRIIGFTDCIIPKSVLETYPVSKKNEYVVTLSGKRFRIVNVIGIA